MELCEKTFVHLAEREPHKLIELIQSSLTESPHLLTFAAEALGRVKDSTLACQALIPLLQHTNSVVREGAIYGLSPHLEFTPSAIHALIQQEQIEQNPTIKDIIKDTLYIHRLLPT